MKRYLLAAIAACSILGAAQANSQREVAYCDPGFNIETEPGDKAACVKRVNETYRDYLGVRNCLPGQQYRGNEASDGGDLCDAAALGVTVAAVAAPLCHLDPNYIGKGDVKTDLNRNARDRCYVNKTRTVKSFGDVKTRNESL